MNDDGWEEEKDCTWPIVIILVLMGLSFIGWLALLAYAKTGG